MKDSLFSEKRKRVMVIDDEADIASLVGERLSESGFETEIQWDLREAIKKLKNSPFDLVVTDLKMPYIDGFQLMGWMKDFSPLTKVAVITAHGSPTAQRNAINSGAVLYIEKPFDLDEFAGKIEEIMQPSREFEAKIESISPFDLIQIVSLTGGSRRISVVSSKGTGEMYIKNGKLVYAQAEGFQMEEAFNLMLSWDSGIFNVLHWVDPPVESGPLDISFLLLEAAKAFDEKHLAEKEKLKTASEHLSFPDSLPKDKDSYDKISSRKDVESSVRLDDKWKIIQADSESVARGAVKASFFLNEWGKNIGKKFSLHNLDGIVLSVSGRELWIRTGHTENQIFLLSQGASHGSILKEVEG